MTEETYFENNEVSSEDTCEEKGPRVFTLNGLDLKRLVDGLDLGKARLEPDQEIRFTLSDDVTRVICSNKLVFEKEDGWKSFQPDTYIEVYNFDDDEQ